MDAQTSPRGYKLNVLNFGFLQNDFVVEIGGGRLGKVPFIVSVVLTKYVAPPLHGADPGFCYVILYDFWAGPADPRGRGLAAGAEGGLWGWADKVGGGCWGWVKGPWGAGGSGWGVRAEGGGWRGSRDEAICPKTGTGVGNGALECGGV